MKSKIPQMFTRVYAFNFGLLSSDLSLLACYLAVNETPMLILVCNRCRTIIACRDDFGVHIKFKKTTATTTTKKHLPLCAVLPGPSCKSKTVRVYTDTCKPAVDLFRNLSL